MEALSRSGRSHWGIDRKWVGNYMNISSENLDTEGYRTALSKEGVAPTKVVFSAKVNSFRRLSKALISKRGPVQVHSDQWNPLLSDVNGLHLCYIFLSA